MTFDVSNVKVSEGQKALAAYVKRETGKAIKAETIAVIDALREAYRKDPERVAERERQKEQARARKEEAYRKAVEKARKLAESLGLPGDFDVTPADIAKEETEPGEGIEDFPPPPPEPDDFDEPEPAPAKTAKGPARKKAVTGPDLTVVEGGKKGTPQDPDTSAILVTEAEDAFETDAPDDDGDDFFDEAEDY
jgi:hypothetical protein